MLIASINVKQHGKTEGYIINDLIYVDVAITHGSKTLQVSAVIDTGSNITVLSKDLADRIYCQIETDNEIPVLNAYSPGSASAITSDIKIGNNIEIADQEIYLMDIEFFKTACHMIIGMDIIQAGDLHIYKNGSLPYFTFEI